MERILRVAPVVGLRGQVEIADALFVEALAVVLIAHHQCVAAVDRVVQARADADRTLRRQHALIHAQRREIGIQRGGDDERVFLVSAAARPARKLALPFLMGPVRLKPNMSWRYCGRFGLVSSGLRELSASLLYCPNACPCSVSVPGLVRISMRPNPGRSYSGERDWS